MPPKNDSNNKPSGLSWTTPQNNSTKPVATPVKQNFPSSAPQGSNSNNTAKYVGAIVGGIIIGVLVAWAVGAMNSSKTGDNSMSTTTPSTTTYGTTTNTATNTSMTSGSDSALVIMSPQAAGTSVEVSKAIVSEPTWVVVYEDNNGAPGNALGAALFFPGSQTGSVALLRATVSGKNYLAAKRVDNGDHKFSLKDDMLLTEGGQVQWVEFAVK